MKYLPFTTVLETVAAGLAQSEDQSATTIRCAINDLLDHYSKQGYLVHWGYNQEAAIAMVKAMIQNF